MADQSKLTPEQKDLVVKWLNEKSAFKTPECPFCRSNKWGVADHLVAAPTMSPSAGLLLGGRMYPHVMVVSEPCGHTVFFNAIVIGLLPPGPPPEEEEKK